MDEEKTREQLIAELDELRKRFSEADSPNDAKLIDAPGWRHKAETDTAGDYDYYRFLFDYSLDAIFLTAPGGIIKSANPAACKIFGMTEEEICRVGRQGLIDPLDPRCSGALEKRACTGEFRGELGFVRKNGSKFDAEVSSVMVHGGMAFVILRDITDRKRADQYLRKSKAKFQAIVENSHDCILFTDENAVNLYRSPSCRLIDGYDDQERRGQIGFEKIHPHDIAAVRKVWTEMLGGLETLKHIQYRFRHKDGTWRWMDATIRNLIDNPNVQAVVVTARDINEHKLAEERLREYEKAVEGLEEMIAVVDHDYRYLIANRAFLKNRGMTRSRVLGCSVAEVLGKDVFEKSVKKYLDECFRGNVVTYEMRYNYPGLGERDLLVSYFPIEGPSGVDRVAAVFQDITERRREERALRESEKRFRMLAEASFEGIGIVVDGRCVDANEQFARFLGCGVSEVIGLEISSMVAPEDRRRVLESIKSGKDSSWQHDMLRKDGSRFTVEVRGRTLNYRGKQARFAVVRDMTERKKAEEALRESEERYRQIAENIREVFWIADADLSRMIYVSPAYEKVWGQTCQSLYANPKSWLDHIHPDDRQRVNNAVLPRTFLGHSVEYRIIRPDGSMRWIFDRGFPVLNEAGEVYRITGIAEDITIQKQIEEKLYKSHQELENRVRERTAELQTVNEELRRIPSRLITAQEEERKRLASELHDSIGQTLAALKYRAEHITSLFKSSKIKEAVRVSGEFVPALQRAIEETRTIYMGLRPKLLEDFGTVAALIWYRDELLKIHPEQHIELDIKVGDAEIPKNLVIPIFRIAQEALNNATRHSKAEWIDLSLEINDARVELIISDDGEGMDLGFILTSSTARSLGLISMRERTELTGGVFSIQSTPGEGTTIRATWPQMNS